MSSLFSLMPNQLIQANRSEGRPLIKASQVLNCKGGLKRYEPRHSWRSSTFSSALCWLIVVDVFFAPLSGKDSFNGLGHQLLVERQNDHDEAETERELNLWRHRRPLQPGSFEDELAYAEISVNPGLREKMQLDFNKLIHETIVITLVL